MEINKKENEDDEIDNFHQMSFMVEEGKFIIFTILKQNGSV